MRILTFILLFHFSAISFGQTLPTSRSTDWTIAGLRDTTYPSTLVIFSGDNSGATDNSSALISLLAGLSQPTIIQFEEGTFLFNAEIALPSNVVIRGKGAGITTLNFDLGGATEGCFTATGTEPNVLYPITANAAKEDFTISLASTSAFVVGDYVRFQKDDQSLLNDSWAYNRTGQISRIASLTATTITLESPLRMDYLLTENPRLKKVTPKTNIGIECLTINRVDQVSTVADRNKISKIKWTWVVNSWVKGVESINCNYSHFEALYCANLLLSECYFHDAFDFGDGGRAYGVMLHFATSESRVENSIFKTLRHAMILQAGANGNVFAYNFSDDAKKTFGSFSFQSEDLVCHGNYPYLNLFEGNIVESPSVDNSHGANGPYNTFFRNRSTSNAFRVSASSSGNQNFLGNEGSKSLAGSGHLEVLNSWNGTSGILETSLAYNSKPAFLKASEFGAIGYGYFGVSAQNPANKRFIATNYIAGNCGFHVWDGTNWENNFAPNASSAFYSLQIEEGSICNLTNDVVGQKIEILPGGRLALAAANNITLSDTLYLKASATKYSQFLGDAALPAVYEMVLSTEGWHLLSFPLENAAIAQIEDQLQVNYSGYVYGASAFTWNPVSAEYETLTNNSYNLGSAALNLFTADFLVKTGKGINEDGNLPVKLIVKGTLKNGAQSNAGLGYGTAKNVIGTAKEGWNLMMNPFPTAIDLDVVFASVPANFQAGAHVYNPSIGNYEVRTLSAINNGNPSTIAPGQAFFVKLDAGADLSSTFYDFNNSVRSLATSPPLYKNEFAGISLFIIDQNDTLHSARVYFSTDGSEKYSAERDVSFFGKSSSSSSQVCFDKANSANNFLSIAGYGELSETKQIPFAVYSANKTKLKIGIKKDDITQELYLKDLKENTLQAWNGSVEITVDEGWNANRFSILTKKPNAESNEIQAEIRINTNELAITFWQNWDENSAFYLTDLAGRIIAENGNFLAIGEVRFALPNIPHGVYILRLKEDGVWKSLKVVL